MRMLLVLLLCIGAVVAQDTNCPQSEDTPYLITQDEQTREVTEADLAEYQPEFPAPELINMRLTFDINNEGQMTVDRTMEFGLGLFQQVNLTTNLQVQIVPVPQVPTDGTIDCVQVPCPGTFGSDVVCWKCHERLAAPSSDPDTESNSPDPTRLLATSKQLPGRTTTEPKYILVTSTMTDDNENDDDTVTVSKPNLDFEDPNEGTIILICAIALVVLCLCCCLGYQLRKRCCKD